MRRENADAGEGKEILFTCVVPVLNQGKYLLDALESLERQQAEDLEVLVMDGGSTDQTLDILKKFQFSRSKYVWHSERDSGQSEALNRGFSRARGKWLFWLNADDLILPGAIDLVRKVIQQKRKCSWVAGNMVVIDSVGNAKGYFRSRGWRFEFLGIPIHVSGPSSFFTKDLFQKVGGFDETLHYAMDTDAWMKFAREGEWFHKIPQEIWAFRVHEGSKTTGDMEGRRGREHREEDERIWKRYGIFPTRWKYMWTFFVKVIDGSIVVSVWKTLWARVLKHNLLRKVH